VLPLQPAGGIDEGAVFLSETGRGQQEDFGVYFFGVSDLAVVFLLQFLGSPKRGGLGFEILGDDQPLELAERLDHLDAVRSAGHGVHAERDQAFHLAGVHIVEQIAPTVVRALGEFRQVVVAELVLGRGVLAVVGLEQAGHELRRVAPVVERIGAQRFGGVDAVVLGEAGPVGAWNFEVAGQHVPGAHIGRALDVRMSALRVDAAAGHADVTQHELQHGGV
jgi:hypothetical protein